MSYPCLVCNHNNMHRVRRYRAKTRHGRAIFGSTWLYACGQCGLVQAAPRPTLQMIADYYYVDYRRGCFAGADVADVSRFPKDNLFYYNRGQSIAELIVPHLQQEDPRILDAGAGYGHILYALGQRYPHATRSAIEFSEVCVQHLRSLGIQVFSQPVEEALPRMEQQFDLIVLSHVLEHLLDPSTVLQLIHTCLARGGLLYIEVPNIPAESLRRYPDSVWAPRFDEPHITFFSVRTLRQLLESTSFDVRFCDTAGLNYKYISALQFHLPHWRWFLQRLIPPALFHFLRRQRVTRSLRVQERDESFYQYGGYRIWLRAVARKAAEPMPSAEQPSFVVNGPTLLP